MYRNPSPSVGANCKPESREYLFTAKGPQTLVHPRRVYADALTDRDAAPVVARNHPSECTEPSPETER
jgi:DNA repair protein RadC